MVDFGAIMRSIVKWDFFWPFAGGFLLGTIGLFALQPADAPNQSATRIVQQR